MDNEDEIRTEYLREDLGKGVRGKYFKQYAKGTNLVLLDDRLPQRFRQPKPLMRRYWDCLCSLSRLSA